MEVYRSVWNTIVAVLAPIAFVAAARTTGWFTPVVVTVAMTSVGALFGFVWNEDPLVRRRTTLRVAVWFGMSGLLLVGLTPVLQQWGLLILLVLGGTSPDLLERCLVLYDARRHRGADPGLEELTYRELERRWRTTTWRVRSTALPVRDRLELVSQRGRLLDELERRDPDRFEGYLVRAGWREPQGS